jgi:hypothetical protein
LPARPAELRRERLRRNRSGKAAWSDLFKLLGVVFLILAIVVFALLALTPTGVTTPPSWNVVLLPLAGGFGIVLIGIGMYESRSRR